MADQQSQKRRATTSDLVHARLRPGRPGEQIVEGLALKIHRGEIPEILRDVTIFALDFPFIFAGSLYVELLFSWPGMGRLYYDAATARDYPVLLAVLIIGSGIIILANLMADIAYAYLDPRVRYD